MKNKNMIVRYAMVLADRRDGTVEMAPTLYESESQMFNYFKEIWAETHYILKVVVVKYSGK